MVGTGNKWQPYYVQPKRVLADYVMRVGPADIAEAFAGSRFRSVPLVPVAYEVEDRF